MIITVLKKDLQDQSIAEDRGVNTRIHFAQWFHF